MHRSYTNPEEVQGLLGSPSTTSKQRSPQAKIVHARLGRGILLNRYAILVVIAGVTVAGWYAQHQFIDLQSALQSEQDKVQVLQGQINQHEQVIQRFNASITNTDVMNRLGKLETQFLATEQHLRAELAATQRDITNQLQNTVQELSTTVAQAEDEISQQVDKVKRDVEQYVLTTQDQFSMENSFMVYQLAGTFTLLSCLISMWHMTAHMRKMNEPDVQRRILAILWMSPVYAVTSWFSLVFHSAEGYLAIVKDGYEAYIIYQFLSFCIAVLGKGDREKVVDLLARHADHLTPPFRLFGCCEYMCGCCKPEPYENNRALADAILLQCQFFAMQFVLFRPLTTTAMVVLGRLKYYGAGDGPTDYRAPQFYITIIQNLSIFVAFTGLLKFYHAVDKELAWCRPFAKFLCIKGVVFMTFWQGLAISVLAQTTDVGGQDEEEWAKSAQNFLICLEMLLFSIAHFYCFPTDEWAPGYRVKHEQGKFGDTIALGDFFNDVKLILQSKPKKKKKRRHSPLKSTQKLEAVPEGRGDDDNNPDGILDDADEAADECDEEIGERNGSSGSGGPPESEEENRSYTTASSSRYDNESSFDDSQAMEGSESETDEDDGVLSRRFQGLSVEDRKIAKALEKSLGLAATDPDIAEAARRLLETGVLSPDFFQSEVSDDENVYRLYGADRSFNGTDDGEDDDEEENSQVGTDDGEEGYVSFESGVDDNEEEDDARKTGQENGRKVFASAVESSAEEGQTDKTRNSCGSLNEPSQEISSMPSKDRSTPQPKPKPEPLDDTPKHTSQDDDVPTPKSRPSKSSVATNDEVSNTERAEDKIEFLPPELREPEIQNTETAQTSSEDSDHFIRSQPSRTSSEGGFWAFEDNVPTPVRSTDEPAPLPKPNETTPLLSKKSSQEADAPEPSTPLKPSIFTTVAALAEESDGELMKHDSRNSK